MNSTVKRSNGKNPLSNIWNIGQVFSLTMKRDIFFLSNGTNKRQWENKQKSVKAFCLSRVCPYFSLVVPSPRCVLFNSMPKCRVLRKLSFLKVLLAESWHTPTVILNFWKWPQVSVYSCHYNSIVYTFAIRLLPWTRRSFLLLLFFFD